MTDIEHPGLWRICRALAISHVSCSGTFADAAALGKSPAVAIAARALYFAALGEDDHADHCDEARHGNDNREIRPKGIA